MSDDLRLKVLDAVVVALLCDADHDMDQTSVFLNNLAILERVRAGAAHDGDCTKQSHTCFVCLIGEYQTRARAFLRALPDELNPILLLETNAREVERRRAAEAEIGRLRHLLLQFAQEAHRAVMIGAEAMDRGNDIVPVDRQGGSPHD